ncbi:YifB family Mg chelatase-like AAA ATPase [Neobacillus sp. MM2021_6]|uniref:YifB family Mg chelatase-like AAA ATPase n=1 Tax=Bacillaceae TaxID=186817 RepID=UPI00140E51D7|nr:MULTISPECIES: YifB family Mg chelatase-like AAA ATPase [Bacillaceae]MBO0958647.1 YifB family Mg chelatase-like AAA ATPase [Neobacillus sp. MM2021_6]NHC20213.1 YifB family Mg chelatase-like AAA ATPase [Bacillus sp. MM2020_4]
MWARVTSIGLKGMEGYRVNVEVGTYVGNDSFKIVGLHDAAVKESKERIIAALSSLGYILSGNKIIINLSPADQKKIGPMFDFPMAIGLLLSLHEVEAVIPEDTGFLGALSLDGSVQPVEGLLPAVLAAKRQGIRRLYIPLDDHLPILDFEGLEIIHVASLKDVIGHFAGQWTPYNLKKEDEVKVERSPYLDFQQIIGHASAKHALEIAAAGEHHVLMTGPPGCGKSLLAESFPSILPVLTKEAQLEVLSLYQLSRNSYTQSLLPPFRSPHHSASGVAIIGGGQYPKPGEISLAHRGVLFLDEIGEFPRKTLDMLRQPLENGFITISRTHATITYPASFVLIAAMNPCPCGYAGSNAHYCTCSPKQILTYQNRLSGPLRDRFDINLTLRPVDLTAADGMPLQGEPSSVVRERVGQARERQYNRYGEEICNSRVPYEVLLRKTPLTGTQQLTLQQQAIKKNWSNRTQIKIIRLARTISDLQGSTVITDQCLNESITLNTV